MEDNKELKTGQNLAKEKKSKNLTNDDIATQGSKQSIELILKDPLADYIDKVKKKVDIFADNLTILLKEYDEESGVKVISVFKEKDSTYIKKINDSHLHYVFSMSNKCVLMLSLDNLSIKTFVAMLLQLKIAVPDAKEVNPSINDVTNIEKSLLRIVVDMVINALKTSFNVLEVSVKQVLNLSPYISENTVAITDISLGSAKGSVGLILEPDFIKKYLFTNENPNVETMKKNIENVKVELKFSTNDKRMSLNHLNTLKEGEVMMFDNKINILVNNKKVGLGEMGHMGNNMAVMCTNFNKE